ncbi:MAG: hypothetical protein JXR96_02205 [Deltaproteobacteria bacterium]|nr:hypothetical protein [Deltaproteobacteria bacterium]
MRPSRTPLGPLLSSLLPLLAALACSVPPVVRPPDKEVFEAQSEIILNAVRELGANGDWLITRGYHVTDHLVTTATGTPISHAAVLDWDRDEVIESESSGVHTTSLKRFIGKSHRVLLVRPVWSIGGRGDEALARARAVIGKPYDFAGLVGVQDSDRFYCSELAMYAYKPWQRKQDRIPLVIEPGQMYLWGQILFDSRPRHWNWP